ncbi:stalk domain-containing protein [Paenibacillus marinisediminis]
MTLHSTKRIISLAVSTLLAAQLLGMNPIVHADYVKTNELILTPDSSVMMLNGQKVTAKQPITEKEYKTYVPLASIAPMYGYTLSVDSVKHEVIASKEGTSIRFAINTTQIIIDGQLHTSSGVLYTQNGSLMVPLRTWAQITGSSLAVTGNQLTLSWDTMVKEYDPPIADFSTDKTVYKQGENIYYYDHSYDNELDIVRRTWTGNEAAFFEEGEHEITLEVQNSKGLTSSITKSVTITNEKLYSPEEHGLIFTPVGGKYTISGGEVLDYKQVPYFYIPEQLKMVRANSPELLQGDEGISYRETASGPLRMNIHNQNRSKRDLKVYLLATNHQTTDVELNVDAFGMGGPTQLVTTSGQAAVTRFLESINSAQQVRTMKVPAGKTIMVLPEISAQILKPGLTMTSHTNLSSNGELEYSVVVVEPSTNPIEALPKLKILDRDGKHVRGTFLEGNRTFVVDGLLGEQKQRLIVADNSNDPYLDGVDSTSGIDEINFGNNGVLYNMTLEVAPHTVVGLNARGGHYAGAFLINGQVVKATEQSILKNPNEIGVLHRTGDKVEKVDITFVLASGSNMPINLLFMPIPDMK